MNDTPDNHVMKDRRVIEAEAVYRSTLVRLASDWIKLKEVRLEKLYKEMCKHQRTEWSQDNEDEFVKESLSDPDFQSGAVNDDICADLDEEIANQVNERYAI